jgi:hypothetical protein
MRLGGAHLESMASVVSSISCDPSGDNTYASMD